jgi:aryl-alcohol dehydrogenase-like predicted oxidoreductase/HEAT repeat protein
MTAIPQPVIDLFSWDPEVRREALQAVPAAAHYALRQVLLLDPHADLRALAATRLASCPEPDLAARWLGEALADPLPVVREAALRALARTGGEAAVPRVQELALEEPVWWVRRTAALALAALAQGEAVPTLRQVLADPFWRVRHGAVRALLLLGRADEALRPRILAAGPGLSDVQRAALQYLRAALEQDQAAPLPGPPSDEPGTWDPDPAVAAAHLKAGPPVAPIELVPLLGASHAPLRQAAARRLAGGADLAALREVVRLLDEPRVPHAAETAAALLDRLGERAQRLAEEVLRDAPSAGAVAWACAWTAATRCEALYPLLALRAADPAPRLRRPAVAALGRLRSRPLAPLCAALGDPDAPVREAAALALAGVRDEGAQQALLALPYADQPVPVRCAVIEAARRRGARDLLRGAARDPHPLPRALALRALMPDGLPEGNPAADPDPWVRAAVLSPVTAREALLSDPDPLVRRAALHLLLAEARRGSLDAAERAALAQAAGDAADPEVRARAVDLMDRGLAGSDIGLRLLLRLSRDPAPMVRAAAADRLEEIADLRGRLQALLAGTASAPERAAAYAHLIRPHEPGAEALLRHALSDPAEPSLVRAQLGAMAALFGDPPAAASRPQRAPAVPRPARQRHPLALRPDAPGATDRAVLQYGEGGSEDERRASTQAGVAALRPLGTTGLAVAPLGLSGAQALPEAAFRTARAAGVNLFFWEPSYLTLTRFLRRERRQELVLVAGSFHAERGAIEADVERALRRLRTDHLDVFLLFWARSPARLSAAAFEWLSGLRQAGKIRSFGFSTHHRDLAAQALAERPWPVIMTRHSAAHPGAEEALLPLALRQGTGVLTFSALCYGRLLQPIAGAPPPPSAADCYRYSLSQPGVAACLSAPRRFKELAENLEALRAPVLPPEALAALRAHGRLVHAEDRRFDHLVRKGQPARPALLQLLAEPAEDPAVPARELRPRRRGGGRTLAFFASS